MYHKVSFTFCSDDRLLLNDKMSSTFELDNQASFSLFKSSDYNVMCRSWEKVIPTGVGLSFNLLLPPCDICSPFPHSCLSIVTQTTQQKKFQQLVVCYQMKVDNINIYLNIATIELHHASMSSNKSTSAPIYCYFQ